jgi:16S rRNA processing protein RimM
LKSATPASEQDGTDDFVVLGRISGVYGLRGWVKVYAETRERTDILEFDRWYLRRKDSWQAVRVIEGRAQAKGVIAQLEGVSDCDQARALIGTEIAVRRTDLPPAEPGTYYWDDLVGLKVVNLEGVEFGTVSHLFETGGANDVVVVQGERERLIPYIKDVVKSVDLKSRVMRVDWDADF